MESKKRRHFPDAFKREAVRPRPDERPDDHRGGRELGLHETVLRRWMRRFGSLETGPARRPIPQAQGPSPADLAAENARLTRELQKAEMERDILKNRPGSRPACARQEHLVLRSEAGRAAAVSLLVGSTPLKNVAHGFMRT